MNEKQARTIATELASEIGLPIRSGAVLVQMTDDGAYQLLVSADPGWLAGHNVPSTFKGLTVLPTDRIVGHAHFKSKAYA
jgi:hypothetical protein